MAELTDGSAYWERPYWIVDILPRQVPAQRGASYAAAEQALHDEPWVDDTYRRLALLLLKLSCYYDLCRYGAGEDGAVVAPRELARLVCDLPHARPALRTLVLTLADGAAVALDGDDLYLTLYGPSAELLATVRQLAGAQGLFVWQPPQDRAH